MKRILCVALPIISSLLFFTACVYDDLPPCPALTLNVGVEDYNYSNAATFDTESLRPTNGPLSTYVSTLSWSVTDVATGRVVAERAAYAAPNDRCTDTVTLPDTLPFGRYVVSVWGSMPEGLDFPDLANLDDPDDDPYLVHDTLTYDARHANHTVLLRRIKSKLDITVEGLPEAWGASSSQKKETGLYEECDKSFVYDGEMQTGNRSHFKSHEGVNTHTVLPPSVGHNQTTVTIRIYDPQGNEIPQLTPRPVTTTLYRNTITALRYVYVIEKQDYDIYVRINDDWEVINNMVIE